MNTGESPNTNGSRFADLLAAARAGDNVAVGRLLEDHGTYLRAIAASSLDSGLRTKESPSDLIQRTYLEALEGIDQFRGETEAEFRQWLAHILQHNLADTGRRYHLTQKRRVTREFAIEYFNSIAGDDSSPSTALRRSEQDDQLQAAIERLPENYRRAVELRHRENLEFAELGACLGVSAEAARKLWARAIDRLRGELASSDGS